MKNLFLSTLNAQLNLFNFKKLLLMIIPLVFLWSCKYEENSVPHLSLKTENNPFLSPSSCSPGGDTTCIEPSCSCSHFTCCTRTALDPCDYDDMYDYALAVACELSRIGKGCQQTYYSGLCDSFERCYNLGAIVPNNLLDLIADSNPFRFCSRAECGTYYCPGESWPYRHFAMSIAYQNAIMSFIRGTIAPLIAPICEGDEPATLGTVYVKACKIDGRNCENLAETDCHDVFLSVRCIFWCCPD